MPPKKQAPLPQKEAAHFRTVIRFYETKQYKKGVKAADTILKKFPDHGETLCMKGLTISFLAKKDSKEEAYDLVKKGLMADMGSHVCWHVYGLLYRQDREYLKAVNAYRSALRIDPENTQILRDLALLQIHTRDYSGCCDTRVKLLQAKPQNRMHWMGYVVSMHFTKDYAMARLILDQYVESFKDTSMAPYETSEIIMYKAMLLEEEGELKECKNLLAKRGYEVVDPIGLHETLARIAFRLGEYDDAAVALRYLLKKLPENGGYAMALLSCDEKVRAGKYWPAPGESTANVKSFPASLVKVGCGGIDCWMGKHVKRPEWREVGNTRRKCRLATHSTTRETTKEEQEHMLTFFDGLATEYPKSETFQFLPLYFTHGDLFKERCDKFLQARIRKGVPSLFAVLKPLYYLSDGRVQIIDELINGYIETLSADISTFDGKVEEAPPTLIFTQLFLAQHLDLQAKWNEALEVLETALADTPTLPELHTCKARVLKHMGDLNQSCDVLNGAREMDLADRFLNTMAVRGLLRKDEGKTAKETILLFDFHAKEASNPEEGNLFDMQVMWFEYHLGLSLKRKGEYGLALKRFHDTFKHFRDIQEDQFDFHSYCFRKTTLRTYVRYLRMMDELYSHKFYRRSAKAALQIYQLLLENPEASKPAEDDKEMTAAEKKKLKHQKARAAKQAAPKAEVAKEGTRGKGKVDEDPKGEKLLVPEKINEDVVTIVQNLQKFCPLDRATYKWAYFIQARRGKHMLCLQALVRLYKLGGKDKFLPKLAPLIAHFCFKSELDKANASVVTVACSQVGDILGTKCKNFADLQKAAGTYVDELDKRLDGKMRMAERVHYLSALVHAGKAARISAHAKKLQPAITEPLKECVKMVAFLKGNDAGNAAAFNTACGQVYPLAKIFKEDFNPPVRA